MRADLNRVPLIPAVWKGKPISIDKANELPVMLDLVFKQPEGKLNLTIAQVREVHIGQPLTRGLQDRENRLLYSRSLETAREPLPAAGFNGRAVAFARANDAPELIRDSIRW
jgi:hypothetical protein